MRRCSSLVLVMTAIIALQITLAAPARAAVVAYTSLSSFNAATSGLTISSLNSTMVSQAGFTGTFGGSYGDQYRQFGLLFSGTSPQSITSNGTIQQDATFNNGNGTNDDIEIGFVDRITAIYFDQEVYQSPSYDYTTNTIQFYNGASLVGSATLKLNQNSQNIRAPQGSLGNDNRGFVSTVPFNRVVIKNTAELVNQTTGKPLSNPTIFATPDQRLLDFRFETPASLIPEPASLTAVVLAALALLNRRQPRPLADL